MRVYFERDRETGKLHLVWPVVNGGTDWLFVTACIVCVGFGLISGWIAASLYLGAIP